MAYGRPGVYVTERLLPAPISAGNGAVAAGACVARLGKGPSTVTLVNSWYEFTKVYGGYDIAYPATFGIGNFFKSGGTQLYVRRILHSDATAASYSIAAVSGTVGTVTARDAGADGTNLRVQFAQVGTGDYWNVTITKDVNNTSGVYTDDVILEQYNNVVFNNASSPDFIETVVNLSSPYITFTGTVTSKTPNSTTPNPLTGGTDGGALTTADYTTGGALADFETLQQPLVIFAPEIHRETLASGSTATAIQEGIISWAGTNDAFAVLDTPADQTVAQAVTYASARANSSNAAVYYPNVYIADPLGRNATSLRKTGPAGAVAGLYLATDAAQGPFKSPAGLRAELGGVVALERRFTSTDLDTLNSSSSPVNAVRDIPGAGVVVMGARTLKQDGTANRYVSMRRSLIYVKKQLKDITQFALFENNDERLWARIRTAIGIFLNDYRNQGGLAGAGPDDSFYVICDTTNNSASTIAGGEVHIEVGVSLEYPAEFVVITLSQMTAN
jgi:phage tail sheath protein FI